MHSQSARPADRIITPIDPTRRALLQGHRTPRADARNDEGPVDPSLPLRGMALLLKRTPAQTAALERLLEEQQDPASPNYHAWLTPDEFGDRFGPSLHDIDSIATWLESQGFRVDARARGRGWITFSGDAGQVNQTFQTTIHHYRLDSELHYANSTDPSIPAALEPLVLTIQGLDDFRLSSARRIRDLPHINLADGSHGLFPADLATIYNLNPLYQKGINGTGQKLAVVGQTRFAMSDVQSFRTQTGLPKNDPQLVLVPGSADPGITDDLGEALLDLEYAGAIAPNATVLYVYSTNVLTSAQYAIDQNIAPVMSMSYGGCELAISANGATAASAFRSVAQQANAQGMTWVASSGDSGAAACEPQQISKAGTHGMTVAIPASVPEVTGVGGTEFNEGAGSFWGSGNTANGSALSYIPEKAWNDTALEGGLASTGGGTSTFYTKPSWQAGPGVPNDNARHVPDVAVAASWDHDFYLTVENGKLRSTGGTSAAAPVFAGMLVLLNQYQVSNGFQSKPGLGNINPNLYRLAQTTSGVFHDVTVGNNIVPCAGGTTGCTTGTYGYSAGTGYDQATGLGSVDLNSLAINWRGAPAAPTSVSTATTLTANPAAFIVSGSTVLTATVKAASGTTSPSGAVTFTAGKTVLGVANLAGTGGTAAAALTVFGSQLSIGVNTVNAVYDGTTTFAPSSASAAVTLTVPASSSSVVVSIVPNPIYQQDPDSDGYAWFYTVRLTEVGGSPTTLTSFSIAGTDHTADIVGWFGSATLPARGTLSAAIRSINVPVPLNRVFLFGGSDANGQKWSQQLSIPFLPQQISASMALSSSPGTEVQNPKGDPSCGADFPFYQQLNLQELNGYGVQLTRFLAGGNDMSSSIAHWFGSQRLAPLGALHANICWQIDSLPATLSYEIDGVDSAGHKIAATLSVPFQGPGQSSGALSASRSSIALTATGSSSATSTLTVNVPAGEQWTVSSFPANQKSSWLVAYPQSGRGSTQVTLVVSAAGLASGVYNANLVFQSVNTIPQFVNVPVTFTIGASSSVVISGLTNGASFTQTFAPGMIMSIFGSRLSNTTKSAPSVPLPTSLDGVSVTVNGVKAPLYFISSGQLNVQVPYETPAGAAVVAVNNNGLVNSANFTVAGSAPGIFTGGNGAIVPISSAGRGQSILMYITGEGDTTPMLDTGVPPAGSLPISGLPAPRGALTMSVGGVTVVPFFVGIPYGLVGVMQINFTVPVNAPLGLQPVTVSVGGIASKNAALNITATAASDLEAARPPMPPRPLEVLDAPQRR